MGDGDCGMEMLDYITRASLPTPAGGVAGEDLTFGDSQHRECAADGH